MGTLQQLAPRRASLRPDLSALAHAVDERRYVCPDPLGRRLGQLLSADAAIRVLLLSGPSGTGKSAALREAARRATRAGFHLVELDGRQLAAAGPRLDDVFADLPASDLLIVVDELGELGATAHALGETLAGLPDSTRVVAAARQHPHHWLPEHLAPLVADLRMPPLTTTQAHQLLDRHGVADAHARRVIGAWAHGLPLALVLGAATWDEHGDALTDPGSDALTTTAEGLVGHVTGLALDQLDTELLEVAAVAGWVDDRLLADVLPERDCRAGLATLTSYSFVERSGAGVTLHPLVAHAVAERVRRDGTRIADLVLRIASHLRDRAGLGDARALHQLAGLSEDPHLRAGLAPALSPTLYGDDLRAADIDEIGRWAPGDLAAAVRPWMQSSPPGSWRTPTQVVRHTDGRCVAAAIALPLAEAAAIVRAGDQRGELVAPLVKYAARHDIDDRTVISPFQLLRPDALAEDLNLIPFRNESTLRRSRVPNPRFELVNELGWTDLERRIVADCGYQELPELRREVRGREVRTWFLDVGSEGLVGLLFRGIAGEHGRELPGPRPQGELVLTALEGFHDDRLLATLPVAPLGHDVRHAADAVRTWVRRVTVVALHDQPDLIELIERRCFAPAVTHDEVLRATYLSRATYFRRLRAARGLVSATADRLGAPL